MTATTATTVLARDGQAWPVTRDGWAALITGMRERAPLVFGPEIAALVAAQLEVAWRLLGSLPDDISAADARWFARTFGPLLAEIRDQAGPAKVIVAAPSGRGGRQAAVWAHLEAPPPSTGQVAALFDLAYHAAGAGMDSDAILELLDRACARWDLYPATGERWVKLLALLRTARRGRPEVSRG